MKRVIFLHIPKTGGTTLHQIIERQYSSDSIYTLSGQNDQSIESLKLLSESKRNAIRVLKGHMYFGLLPCLSQPNAFITFLRDPINRIISHYSYVSGFTDHFLHNNVKTRGLSLQEYAESKLAHGLDNGQTRLISGVEGAAFGEVTRMMLEKAKENLRKYFIVVGITEKFDETLILLKRTFGWKNCFYIQANVSKNRMGKKELSKKTLEIIKERNALDIELHHFASEILDEAISRQGTNFWIELRAFKAINQAYQATHFFDCAVGSLKRGFLQYVQT